ncbi:hypothetical protein ACFVIM_34280 [Streptomyces sp. NPDC057638]|uniref:hypothetical protein n=1 Tax=Streptomyces sp. NPDC057638 TaxID=3346190 RepID=UPI00369A9CED
MQLTATRPQPDTRRFPLHVRSDCLTTSTWWLVQTRSGTLMFTLCPDQSYAPVNVYEAGYLVPIRTREICDPAERPHIPREVRPDHSAAKESCPVPAHHPVWQMRLHQDAPTT